MNMQFSHDPFTGDSLSPVDRRLASDSAAPPQRPPLEWASAVGECPARRCLLISPCGVLFDDSVWSRWLLQLLGRVGLHTHSQAFLELWRRDYFIDVAFARRDHWEALQAMLTASGLSRGQAEEVCAAARPRWREWQASLHAYPQVGGTLSALSAAGVSLGIAACAPSSAATLIEQLERMSIAHWFDFVVTTFDDGVDGSLPAFYQAAAQQWAASGEPFALKIVTSRREELEAARQSGFEAIAAYEGAPSDIPTLDRFDQLLYLVAPSQRVALAS